MRVFRLGLVLCLVAACVRPTLRMADLAIDEAFLLSLAECRR